MPLVSVACPACAHVGFASGLPRVLRCAACDHAAFHRKGRQTIRARYIDDGSDDDVLVDVEAAWRRYENPNDGARCIAAIKQRKPRRGYSKRGKRVLTPRVPEAV